MRMRKNYCKNVKNTRKDRFLSAGRGGIGAALGADQDVAGAVAVGAVRADAPHEQAGQDQQEPGGPRCL